MLISESLKSGHYIDALYVSIRKEEMFLGNKRRLRNEAELSLC